MTDKKIKMYGRIFIEADIKAVTGLHIGGSGVGMEIGGIDNAIIRNPVTNQPYIPGSSLRGKMRSQLEKSLGLEQNNRVGNVYIHTCKTEAEYNKGNGCPVCHVFGVPGEVEATGPALLVVRDVNLDQKSAAELDKAKSDLPYAELKTEVTIDRVTSAATPRTLERVPAGAVFGPAEMVFGVYDKADIDRFEHVVNALQLVEDDYLGGSGSRGSGKVEFTNLKIYARSSDSYGTKREFNVEETLDSVQALSDQLEAIQAWVKDIVMKQAEQAG